MTVKVVGNLREYEGKTHVLVYDVTPITDWNELTHHILETILTHCKNTKAPPVSHPTTPHLCIFLYPLCIDMCLLSSILTSSLCYSVYVYRSPPLAPVWAIPPPACRGDSWVPPRAPAP
ncbi:hypothetical protein EON65_29050 [archaeon]|nr:MAG: hypothetical protein EON65_29050 [archaeon]